MLTWAAWAAAPTVRLVRAYPVRSAVTIASTLLMVGIVGNATLMQRGRHPAPLFADPPVQASVPLPRARPIRSVASEPSSRGPLVASKPAETDPVAALPQPRPASGSDELGRRRERSAIGAVADDTPTGVAAPKAPDPDVLRAQHALVKLGYDIKPDGHLGAETRKALDKFASTHHLAVMPGTLSPRLLQALTAAAAKPQG